MKISKLTFIALAAVSLILAACKKDDNISDIPHIEFKEFVPMQDSAYLVLDFTDGDGDIGLGEGDTAGDFKYNFFIKYFEKQNGNFVERSFDPPFNYRIPMLTQAGKSRSLTGEIRISVTPFYYDFLSPYDTIKYEIYIKDRALNESNHVTTAEIITP